MTFPVVISRAPRVPEDHRTLSVLNAQMFRNLYLNKMSHSHARFSRPI